MSFDPNVLLALALAPAHGSDSRRVFIPGAKLFLRLAGVPRELIDQCLILFDNRATQAQRYDEACTKIEERRRAGMRIKAWIVSNHGLRDRMQCGVTTERNGRMLDSIAAMSAEDLRYYFAACSTGGVLGEKTTSNIDDVDLDDDGTPDVFEGGEWPAHFDADGANDGDWTGHGDGGCLDVLGDGLAARGLTRSVGYGHALPGHAWKCPWVLRKDAREGRGSLYLFSPRSPKLAVRQRFARFDRKLHAKGSDLGLRYPLQSLAATYAEVDADAPANDATDDTSTRALQAALARGGIDPGPLDGIRGSKTRAATSVFQTRAGLPPTGIADAATWAALRAAGLLAAQAA